MSWSRIAKRTIKSCSADHEESRLVRSGNIAVELVNGECHMTCFLVD